MDRPAFERLRDMPGKVVVADIRFVAKRDLSPLHVAEGIRIDNEAGEDLRLTITYNAKLGSKSLNVHVPGMGPICRLDVDGPAHRPAGRSHKHSLQTDRCPDRNLPDGVLDRPDLIGATVRTTITEFFRMAQITHDGNLDTPDGS